jgi:hypothetical protein
VVKLLSRVCVCVCVCVCVRACVRAHTRTCERARVRACVRVCVCVCVCVCVGSVSAEYCWADCVLMSVVSLPVMMGWCEAAKAEGVAGMFCAAAMASSWHMAAPLSLMFTSVWYVHCSGYNHGVWNVPVGVTGVGLPVLSVLEIECDKTAGVIEGVRAGEWWDLWDENSKDEKS